MTGELAPPPIFQAFAPNGTFLVGGQLFSYAGSTSTPQATFTDSTLGTANTNPVILNAYGQAAVWFDPALTYKLVLRDAAGNLLWTADNISPYINAASLASTLASYATISSLSAYVLTSTLTGILSAYALTSSLAAYALLNSPNFVGTPTAPTAAPGDNSTTIATTAFVTAATGASSGSLTQNGGWTFPGGVILQWGRAGPSAGGGGSPVNNTLIFPTAFPHACFVVVGSAEQVSSDFIGSITATGFTWGNGVAGGFTNWIAVGF